MRARLRRLVFALALGAATVGAAGLSTRFHVAADWTATGSNRLSRSTLDLLEKLTGPVSVVVSASEGGFVRSRVRSLLTPYRLAKPDLDFRFIDPRRLPARATELGLETANEARIEYRGRTEHTRVLSEQGITNALYRLSQPRERWLAALSGHGERRLYGRASRDLGLFGAELESKGLRVRDVNLAEVGGVPTNSAALVVASPVGPLLDDERELLASYLRAGGNLLWLADPGETAAAPTLSALLGVRMLPGTLVAPHPGLEQLSPTVTLVTRYPAHPITRGLRLAALLPTAAGLALDETHAGWNAEPFLLSSDRSWTETGGLSGALAFDADHEVAGPVTVGLALERKRRGERSQRVVVVGDADFLSDRYLANQGNLRLGLRIVDWLTTRGDAIAIPTPSAPDTALGLTGRPLQALAVFALIGLPALLLLCGLTIRWRRRRR